MYHFGKNVMEKGHGGGLYTGVSAGIWYIASGKREQRIIGFLERLGLAECRAEDTPDWKTEHGVWVRFLVPLKMSESVCRRLVK